MNALQVFTGQKSKDFLPQSFATDKSLELCTERAYIILTTQEFEAKFGIAPSQVQGLSVDTFETEAGPVKGVAVIDPDNPHRRLVVRRSVTTQLHTTHANGQRYEPDALKTRAHWSRCLAQNFEKAQP